MNNIEKSSVRVMLFSASYIVEYYSLANGYPSTITPRRKEYARKTSECYLTSNIPYNYDLESGELDFQVIKVLHC